MTAAVNKVGIPVRAEACAFAIGYFATINSKKTETPSVSVDTSTSALVDSNSTPKDKAALVVGSKPGQGASNNFVYLQRLRRQLMVGENLANVHSPASALHAVRSSVTLQLPGVLSAQSFMDLTACQRFRSTSGLISHTSTFVGRLFQRP